MKHLSRTITAAIVLSVFFATGANAQEDGKEIVIVLSQDYTYEDPRWGENVTIDAGTSITVLDSGGEEYQYWPYPASDTFIPKSLTHLPGQGAGERYFVLTGTNVRLREGPSLNHGYYCANILSGASVYHNQFVKDRYKPREDEWGLRAEWEPIYLPKGTRLVYLGQKNGFFKTQFNGQTFYISSKYCKLKN